MFRTKSIDIKKQSLSNSTLNIPPPNCEKTDTSTISQPRKDAFDDDLLLNQFDLACDKDIMLRKKYEYYLAKVRAAHKNRKIFFIGREIHTKVRESLRKRGWLEKLTDKTIVPGGVTFIELLELATDGNVYERWLISKMLALYPANFLYMVRYPKIRYVPASYRCGSRICSFASKPGLWTCVQNSQWGSHKAFAPRTHILTGSGIRQFLEDYHLTQCLSLLQFIVNSQDVFDAFGSIRTNIIEFAIEQIEQMVRIQMHADIDQNIIEFHRPNDLEWSKFIEQSTLVIRNSFKFKCFNDDWARYLELAKKVLSSAHNVFEDFHFYGAKNIWILKPTASSRGRGIRMMTDDIEIINFARGSKVRHLAQKYIERPMLIYQTKFDIRQHFLLSTRNGFVDVWMYKDCYLKFSSQIYSLNKLHRSVHVTNNTVQRRYKNAKRDQRLPPCNMWSSQEFQAYLESIGLNSLWDQKIYPAMRDTLISVVQCNSRFDNRSNAFNLFGADFLITDSYDVVLLEVNGVPDMRASTSVTGCLCPRVLEDLVKVIVDLPEDASASTGDFELILKLPLQAAYSCKNDLRVESKKLNSADLNLESKLRRKMMISYPISIESDLR